MPPAPLASGLLILHGNRLERLAETVFAWLAQHPLEPLEEEVFLVQSNGMAEWLKMQLAAAHGICAATRVELPARFVWRAYRSVLGRQAVPAASALDKLPLAWRLMALLPDLARQPGFAPVAAFLGPNLSAGASDGTDAIRRLQLARRLADLFDQYQVYRAQWLHDWASGHDVLRPHAGTALVRATAVPADQAWQPALWRAVLAGLSPAEQQAARPVLHQRFLKALTEPSSSAAGHADTDERRRPALPRRLVLFGTTHIPHQTLEAIAALQTRCQVLMAVPNPCRWHWADIIDGRELLAAHARRLPLRRGKDLASVPLQAMHVHGHPLLAAWGRQARDFVRQLDAFDDVQQARQRFALSQVDLFDDPPGQSLLAQLQQRILDLEPLPEAPGPPPPPTDRSVVFHLAHSVQREVEILHDQLLHVLAHPPEQRALAPRDIVVMVPDIDTFAPAVRAVFGQYPRGHARHIPWGLADQRLRGQQPLMVALEWLLHAPQQRFGLSQLRDLLDVPAVARRLSLDDEALAQLMQWATDAGVRWGLDQAQRQSLDLGDCGNANTWHFGLQRMLLGWATGAPVAVAPGETHPQGFAGIEPYAEVAGLAAGAAGILAEWIERLRQWWTDARQSRSPAAWAERLRALTAALFEATDDADRALLAALDDALTRWLEACALAGFDAALPLAVAREAWLDVLDAPESSARFRAGGVTFCTLLPLRAIPFEMVCLLGMNDGDYPRRGARNDFDLMALPGQSLPGDRSRRDDDRQLMLDALLSARRVLYISWAARSPRDNQPQPPSVLVGQLRDHLAAGWGAAAVQERSTEHPLQPFSRRYFEAGTPGAEGAGLFTYAAEWRTAHADPSPSLVRHQRSAPAPPSQAPDAAPLSLQLSDLVALLRNPVKTFFRHRLQVNFDDLDEPDLDDESFAPKGLDLWSLLDEALRDLQSRMAPADRPPAPVSPTAGQPAAWARAAMARLQRAGRLPMGGPGQHWQRQLEQTLEPMLAQWWHLLDQYPHTLPPLPLTATLEASDDAADGPLATQTLLQDMLSDVRRTGTDTDAWVIECCPGALRRKAVGQAGATLPRPTRLLSAWLRGLASTAMGQPVGTWLVGTDVCVRCSPPALEADAAAQVLQNLLAAAACTWLADAPLPTALATGLAWLDNPATARQAYEGSPHGGSPAEGAEPCLQRLYPDFDRLAAAPGFGQACTRLYAPLRAWLDSCLHWVALPDAKPLEDDDEAMPARAHAAASADADADADADDD